MNGPTVVVAPAKVNLGLRVLGPRPDGYHEIETIVLPLASGLADQLSITGLNDPAGFRTLSLSLDVSGPPELTTGVPVDEGNAAMAAASALAEVVGARGFAEIALAKGVPSAAGLGGGSADAAAVLRTLNRLWGCDLPGAELEAVAARVGSDVPALLAGVPVLVAGRGDVVRAIAAPILRILVVPFDLRVRTGDAYGWWDADGAVSGPPLDGLVSMLADGPGAAGRIGSVVSNDLQAPVTRRHPKVARAIDLVREAGAAGAVMSGSGPTVFGLLPSGGSPAPDALRAIRDLTGRDPVVCETVAGGPQGN